MTHGHDIPDTPAVRAKLDEAQQQGCEALGIDPAVVAVWEDGFRSKAELERSFEWWYFDMHLDDGSTIVATFNTKPNTNPDGPLDPSVLVIYHGADGTKIREDVRHPADSFSASTEGCDVTIGPNTVTGDLASYTLHIDDAGVTADLTLTRQSPSWRPGAGVQYFDAKRTQMMGWVVPVPYGTVAGTITVNGETRDVTGAAYHDHNWGNKVMSAGMDHWFWGRAHIGDYTVVYVQITTKGLFGLGALHLPTFLLAKGDTVLTDDLLPLRLETSGDVDGPGSQSYPTELTWTWQHGDDAVTMKVTNVELIEALDMAEPAGGLWHRLAHAGDHPMYYDFNADMELSVRFGDIDETVSGRTLFEKMMFR